MKNSILLCVVALLLTTNFVYGQKIEDKPAREGEQGIEVAALSLAKSNAEIGYETQNPIFLISAAQLLIDHPASALKIEKSNEPKSDVGSKTKEAIHMDPAKLLSDAKIFAKGNTSTIAIIENLQKQVVQGGTRGAVGGPKLDYKRVYAYSRNDYEVSFIANEYAEVALVGDNDTDLDLYIFDSRGNLIAQDIDYSDECYVSWIPKWTGSYTIVVVNRGGVYNDFGIATN